MAIRLASSTGGLKWSRAGYGIIPLASGGYFHGGLLSTSVRKIPFATKVAESIGASINVFRTQCFAFDASPLGSGYFAGGANSDSGTYSGGVTYASFNKVNFYTNIITNISAVLSTARYSGSSFQSSTAGYAAGGHTGHLMDSTVINKFIFSTEVASTLSETVNAGGYYGQGRVNTGYLSSSSSGYMCAGYWDPANNGIMEFVFSTETKSMAAGVMPVAEYLGQGLTTSSFGYLPSGGSNNYYKFSYASDSVSSTLAASAYTAKYGYQGFSTASLGIVLGGSATNTKVYQFTFATETDSALSDLSTGSALSAGLSFNS